MAFTVTNPVSVGDETLKSHYDTVFDNTQFLHTNILQVNGASGVSLGDVTYALVGTYGFRLETAADVGIFEANGGYATNGGLLVYGSSHASAGRVTAYTGTAAANGEFLVYDNKNTANVISSTYAKTSIRPVLNLFASANLDIIPGTGTDASIQTTTGGLRVRDDGSMYYYSGSAVGDGFRVYEAHATSPVLRLMLDTGGDQFVVYNGAGQATMLHDGTGAGEYTEFLDAGTSRITINHSSTTPGIEFYTGANEIRGLSGGRLVFDTSGEAADFTLAASVWLPVASANPTAAEGAMYIYSSGGTYQIRVYVGASWRTVTL